MSHWSIGIDIGGTFTDFVAIESKMSRIYELKILTTHSDPMIGVIKGLEELIQSQTINPQDISRVVHASTLFTNALIERTGCVTGLITNQGFKDIIEMGNERKYDLYDLAISRNKPIVLRSHRVEVSGRINAKGEELVPLNLDESMLAIKKLSDLGVQSIAICLLHSYCNPSHEKQLAELIVKTYPSIVVTLSSEVSPIIREYERTSTAVTNAYIKPLANSYLGSFEKVLNSLGIQSQTLMMLSNGGLNRLQEAKNNPIALLESGPAAGVTSAAYFGKEENFQQLLAFDMGGTTAKLCLIENGQAAITHAFEAARLKRFVPGSGIPLHITTVDLIEIGAGGGSIAELDALALLTVGPKSAGSEPGPASYGLGGLLPTVTDANLILGYLNPLFFAGGKLPLSRELALQSTTHLCEALAITATQLALGIHDIVAENMATAARLHVAEHGHDPKSFVLVATGGGGPLHAYSIAKKIGVTKILCPSNAGVASAFGLLIAPARADRSKTISFKPQVDDIKRFNITISDLENEVRHALISLSETFSPIEITYQAEARFVGQGFNLLFDLNHTKTYLNTNKNYSDDIQKTFLSAYLKKFGRIPPNGVIELVNLRVHGVSKPIMPWIRSPLPEIKKSPIELNRPVYFKELNAFVDTPIFNRGQLPNNFKKQGPLLIEDSSTTIVVGPTASIEKTNNDNLLMLINA